MEKNKLIWILFGLSAVLVVISGISLLSAPVGIKEYDVSFTVKNDTVGFNTNTSSLTFGKIPPGGFGAREIFFENKGEEMMEIEILTSENLAEFMVYQSVYSIPGKSNATIPIEVIVPNDAREGEYNGKIRIRVKR